MNRSAHRTRASQKARIGRICAGQASGSHGSLDGYLYFHLGEESAFQAVPFHEAPQ